MNKKTSNINVTRLALAACVVILSFSVAYNIFAGGNKNPQQRKPAGALGASAEKTETVSSVNTENPVNESIMEYFKLNGDVITENSVEIYPDTSGKLVKRFVSIGDYVSKGDIIAKIDPSKPGTVYESSPVESTISGTVTRLPGSIGDTVTTQSSVATIGDLSNLQIQAFIPEKYLNLIKTGLKGEAVFSPYPVNTFPVYITEVSPVVDTDSRTIEVKLSFDNFDSRYIRAGMFASVKVYAKTSNNTLTVPSSSVLTDDIGSYVYIAKNEKAELKYVETGLRSDSRTEIISGISGNDSVIVRGQDLLSDGSSVKIISEVK